jgi:hypothetical protein
MDEATWGYQKTFTVDPDTFDPTRASDRLMRVLVKAGITYNGGPPELSITAMDSGTMTVSINADTDPTATLAGIRKLPLLPAEVQLNQSINRMKVYADLVAAGTQPTNKQMATAILDLSNIIRGAG